MKCSRLEKAKEIIKENINDAQCGIFDCRNIVGDRMSVLYADSEIRILICYFYSYFEVLGLTHEEFTELEKYYRGCLNASA